VRQYKILRTGQYFIKLFQKLSGLVSNSLCKELLVN